MRKLLRWGFLLYSIHEYDGADADLLTCCLASEELARVICQGETQQIDLMGFRSPTNYDSPEFL